MKKLIAIAALAAVLVSSAFAQEFNTIEDLDGKNIGVQTAVLYEELIMDRVPHSTFQYYTMPNDMILALKSGKVDAYLIEEVSYGVQQFLCYAHSDAPREWGRWYTWFQPLDWIDAEK